MIRQFRKPNRKSQQFKWDYQHKKPTRQQKRARRDIIQALSALVPVELGTLQHTGVNKTMKNTQKGAVIVRCSTRYVPDPTIPEQTKSNPNRPVKVIKKQSQIFPDTVIDTQSHVREMRVMVQTILGGGQ